MRILQVIEFFSPSMGGSAQVAYQTAWHLAQRGHQVSVWSSDYGADGSRFPEGSFETVLFPCPLARWGFYPTPALAGWARRHVSEFDVIHLHNLRTFQNLVVAGGARRAGVPYVLSAHGSLSHRVGRRLTKRAFDSLFGRWLIRGAQRLIAVSPVEVDQYRQAGLAADKIAMIPNGLDLDEFAHLPAPGAFRRKHGIPAGAKLVLSLGRIHRIKGLDVLIAAFGRLREKTPGVLLAIAGPDDGGELARLQILAAQAGLGDRVQFPGPLYGEDKLAALADADLVVVPSAYEIFGLVPFEALLCGTPVVITSGSGTSRLLGDTEAAYQVPYGDLPALTAVLQQALTDGVAIQRQVAIGQEFVRTRLDWRAIVVRVEGLYAEVVGSGD